MTRPMTEYYDAQLKDGLLYQDFVYEILHRHGISTVAYSSKLFQQRLGENKAGIEIKHDKELARTGNLWIETKEKSNQMNYNYVVSGIYRECVEYVIGDFNIIYRFSTKLLRRIHETGKYPDRENRMKTSVGFLLPASVGERAATQVFTPNSDEQMQPILRLAESNRLAAKEEMIALLQQMNCNPAQFKLFGDDAR